MLMTKYLCRSFSAPNVRSLYCCCLSNSTKFQYSTAPNHFGSSFPAPGNTAKPVNKFAQKSSASTQLKFVRDEKQFLVAQNDSEVFGAQVANVPLFDPDDFENAEDAAEQKFLENPPAKEQRLSTKQYADMIKDHVHNKRIKEAIDVLEVRMLKEDRVKPENYIFNLLIGACARFGYTKKAFGLYNKMKQRDLKVTGGTYTALFNACSTTPWLQDGLNKANRLREIMLEKGYEPNATNFNAMIKAYGRCGDLKTAFHLVDEMKSKRLPINVDTYNFLLQACASDRELGFRHALLVWHKMHQRRMVPDVYSFNTLLRCVRDCGIGDLTIMEQVIQQILLGSRQAEPATVSANLEENVLMVQSVKQQTVTPVNVSEKVSTGDSPNLLSKLPHLGRMVALSEIRKSEDRLLLLGGISGFLREMELAACEPDIKTFSELIEVIPPTNAAEKKIIAMIRRKSVKCDIDFFNLLIKKRSMRFDYDGAKEVLTMIDIADLQPNIVTYGVLALGCRTPDEADELLQEMYNKGIRMNIQILGAMLKQGCVQHNFEYVLKIMSIAKTERIKPNEHFLKHLQDFHENCFNFKKTDNSYAQSSRFKRDFNNFNQELTNWREFMGLQDMDLTEAAKVVREHPWEQFKYGQTDGIEDLKNPKLRHKKKLSRHIKRINPAKLRDDDVPKIENDSKTSTLLE